jgi:hypothetical protein
MVRSGDNLKPFTSVINFFVISKSVWPWQVLQAYSNKHSGLLRNLKKMRIKEVCNIRPWVQCYEKSL